MRIVAVADTHTFQADLGAIPDGDVFVHAGDLLRSGSLEELEATVPWIHALPHRHKIVVAGNHDGCFATDPDAARALLGDVVYLEDSGAVLDGVRFWGSPWQPAYNDWWFNLPRGAPLAEKWAKIPRGIDVLVTHGPPLGFGDQGPVEGRAGCVDLLERVRQVRPPLHLFGHIHQDGGLFSDTETTFVNVTTWECERMPTVLDYDPALRIVRGVQIPPARNPVSC